MSPPPVRGNLKPGGMYFSLPGGSLALPAPRELLVTRGARAAFEPGGAVAKDTRRATSQLLQPERVPPLDASESIVRTESEEVVWGGFLGAPYGHFMTEDVSRLWPLLPGAELEGLPVVFTAPEEPQFALDWLDAFGAHIVEIPERGVVRFSKMFVPEPAWRFNAWIAPEVRDIHLHARRGMQVAPAPRRDVLWLSRAKLERRRPYDELLLEWLLEEHITVIHPETMPLAEQVEAVESSRAVAGVVGSAFHTLLMAERIPDCVYLSPAWDKPSYGAQHRLLGGNATFAEALSVALWTHRAPRGGIAFPRGYRLQIPEALRALGESVLPEVLEDRRLNAFADLGRDPSEHDGGHWEDDVDAAVAQVVLDPLSAEPRTELGRLFEAEGRVDCAREQLATASDLTGEVVSRSGP